MYEMTCLNCGKIFMTYKGRNKKYCSQKCCYQARDHGIKYKTVMQNGVCKAVHRLIMEDVLGRPLSSDEDVHHINGDIRDNRVENLMVLSHSEHLRLEANLRTSEDWAKISAGRIGKKKTPETRAKMSEARKKWWERKRTNS